MNTQTFLAFIGLLAILLFFRLGISVETLIAISVAALLAAIPWYFGTRDRLAGPSSLECFFANIWVWFRRLLGLGAGLLFLWASWHALHTNILLAATIAALGLFSIYIGIVGQGNNRAAFHDDLALHRNNKRRYKWWL